MLKNFKRLIEPCLFVLLLVLLAGLAIKYPSTLWAGDDYSLEYLAAACNAGARLKDLVMYKTGTMAYHPAVQFYVFSWFAAFAALGTGAIGSDLSFFDRLIDNAPALFVSLKLCTIILMGALVCFYRRAISGLVPANVAILALTLYFVTTPQSVFRSVYPLTETFALAVNALFVIALMRLAKNPLGLYPYLLCGITVAFAYLLKVSFLYAYGALGLAFAYLIPFYARSWVRLLRGLLTFHVVGIGIIWIVGQYVIGPQYFAAVMRLHWAIFTHGPGSEANASLDDVIRSMQFDWDTGATALPIVIVVAPALLAAVLFGTIHRRISPFSGAIAVGAASASLAAVVGVLTRYGPTYVVGASATIPLLLISAWIAAGERNSRTVIYSAGICVGLFSLWRCVPGVEALFQDKFVASAKAEADELSIQRLVKSDRTGLFLYRVSMPGYGKGYVSFHCEVPTITDALLAENRKQQSSMARSVEEPDYVVADKNYSPTEAEVKSGKNLDPINPVKTTYRLGDELLKLNNVWLIIRHKP